MPRTPSNIWAQFVAADQGEKKNARTACKHCGKDFAGKNLERANKHLERCPPYQDFLRGSEKQEATSNPAISAHVGADQKHHLDQLAAAAVHESGLPFGFFQKPAMARFLEALNPAYTAPDRHRVGVLLLDTVYKSVQQRTVEFVEAQNMRNFAADDSGPVEDEEAGLRLPREYGAPGGGRWENATMPGAQFLGQ